MSSAKRLLVTQAVALNTLFGECSRMAAKNMGTHLPATDAYMRMALKAQQQSATTLKILGEIKSPRQVAFIKQQNNAQQQQINNGTAPPSRAREERRDQTNGLLGHQNGEWMDAGTTGETGRGNQALEKPWERSTGPRTDAGKEIAATNSSKHGMRSAECRDQQKQLNSFLRDCRKRLRNQV